MEDETRTFLRGALAFALPGFLIGLIAVQGLSVYTYAAGAACVGAAWLAVPLDAELNGLVRERTSLVGPIALLWPLSGLPVLLFVAMQLAHRPRVILAGAALGVAAIAALVAPIL
jgi:hypothetical protein